MLQVLLVSVSVSVLRCLWCAEGVGVRGVWLGVMSPRRLLSRRVSWRASRRRRRTYRWSWRAGRLRGWTPWGSSASVSMAFHAACGIHPPRRLEAAVLRRPVAGPVDRALEGGLCPGPLSQLSELRVGPALRPLSLGGALALGRGVGVCGCDGAVGTGGGGGSGGFRVVLRPGGAWGVKARADVDLRVRAHGVRLGIGLGLAVAAVAGHLLYVG